MAGGANPLKIVNNSSFFMSTPGCQKKGREVAANKKAAQWAAHQNSASQEETAKPSSFRNRQCFVTAEDLSTRNISARARFTLGHIPFDQSPD
ncbi:hypothetical protein [Paraburkholderia caribensis]|uniref:hypothetical protein n=1 Tax=Paraburkholderia caribensis TaxID=75105 RepID=UPI0011DF6930|nr:hypothetical protein [Paraburkholderia caribensis]